MANKDEINAVNIQLYVLILSLISTIISIITTYNQKLDLENLDHFFNSKDALKITKFNRILILIISLSFLYANYKLYIISKNENEDLKSYKLQIVASILTVIASIIALYVVSLSETETLSDVENPII